MTRRLLVVIGRLCSSLAIFIYTKTAKRHERLQHRVQMHAQRLAKRPPVDRLVQQQIVQQEILKNALIATAAVVAVAVVAASQVLLTQPTLKTTMRIQQRNLAKRILLKVQPQHVAVVAVAQPVKVYHQGRPSKKMA